MSRNRDVRGELDIQARIKAFSAAPGGRLWLGDAMGNTYFADSIADDWRYGPLRQRDTSILAMGSVFDHIDFFDADIGIISGYILGDDHESSYVYRTTDGGARWDRVALATEGVWVYDVFLGRGGSAWAGGSSGRLYHSPDRGLTWNEPSAPFDGSSRLCGIHMGDDGTGLAGALANGVSITRDRGRSWQSLPTPIDQGVLRRPDDDAVSDQTCPVAFLGGARFSIASGTPFFRTEPITDVSRIDDRRILVERNSDEYQRARLSSKRWEVITLPDRR